jgi:hypothetical protein
MSLLLRSLGLLGFFVLILTEVGYLSYRRVSGRGYLYKVEIELLCLSECFFECDYTEVLPSGADDT